MASLPQLLQVAENILTAHPDLDGIFTSNESTTVGTVQAVQPRGFAHQQPAPDGRPDETHRQPK